MPPVVTLDRQMREGFGRHDAIHAMAGVLMGIIFDAFRHPEGKPIDINDAYGRELRELTAASAVAVGAPSAP